MKFVFELKYLFLFLLITACFLTIDGRGAGGGRGGRGRSRGVRRYHVRGGRRTRTTRYPKPAENFTPVPPSNIKPNEQIPYLKQWM
ncbi:hypothetical protein CDAR_234511 [Caerostris darwini]|uniref:Uncharacterized protein n=1 Tax=Caerostris darwini TaxID=1538125 RepID=A0AAV4TLA4_9ARAC|nr:hypothetical protein CDAR_234511 [Caerostris darwini]